MKAFSVIAAAGAALAAPPAAAAHLRTGTVAVDYGADVSSPTPSPTAPFSVGVYQSDRALHISVRRGHTVVVLGYLGERFLRIDAAGVWVDTASPTAAAVGLVPKERPAPGARGWVLRRGQSSVVWHDGRVQQLPPGSSRARWSVPVLVDGRRAVVAGEVWRVPATPLWPWLVTAMLAAAGAGALAFRRGLRRLRAVCIAFGLASGVCAIVAAAGFALSAYASPGTWIAGIDEALFALALAAVLAWGPRGGQPAAGAGIGALGLAVGLSRGAIFLHPVVLSVVPGTVSRALVAVAVGAGLASAAAGAVFYARLDQPLSHALTTR